MPKAFTKNNPFKSFISRRFEKITVRWFTNKKNKNQLKLQENLSKFWKNSPFISVKPKNIQYEHQAQQDIYNQSIHNMILKLTYNCDAENLQWP